jgi:hypothetical protein
VRGELPIFRFKSEDKESGGNFALQDQQGSFLSIPAQTYLRQAAQWKTHHGF